MNELARKVLREPLAHFLLVGALLFGADRVVRGSERRDEIVAGPDVRAPLIDGWIVKAVMRVRSGQGW